MSMRVDKSIALDLKKGDTVFHNWLEFTRKDGTTYPQTAVVVGRCRDDRYEDFWLPVRYPNGYVGRISKINSGDWRTTEGKELPPARVHRVRPAPVQAGTITRVRRTRPGSN